VGGQEEVGCRSMGCHQDDVHQQRQSPEGQGSAAARELKAMTCRISEKVDDFTLHMSNLIINLEELGEEIEEQ
jgi:hypothetical protein